MAEQQRARVGLVGVDVEEQHADPVLELLRDAVSLVGDDRRKPVVESAAVLVLVRVASASSEVA